MILTTSHLLALIRFIPFDSWEFVLFEGKVNISHYGTMESIGGVYGLWVKLVVIDNRFWLCQYFLFIFLFQLACTPTPIQEWKLKNVASDFNLSIKRDDLTGHLISGNKIRKLEFMFADAVAKNSTCILTCGGRQSNHCRTTAIVAKQLGLGCHLLFKNHDQVC